MQDNPAKSKVTALLLCFFLGGLGIHRFYLGYVTIGVIQLLTFGGCGIWALIDFILFLCQVNWRAKNSIARFIYGITIS